MRTQVRHLIIKSDTVDERKKQLLDNRVRENVIW